MPMGFRVHHTSRKGDLARKEGSGDLYPTSFLPCSPTLLKMPLTDRKRAAINKALEANFRKPFGEYDSIAVRAIYWKGEEEGYKKESEAVVSFFKDNLRYDNVGLLPIVEGEGDHSQETLRFHLSQLIYEHGGNPNKLLILHYGGHGDPDDDYSGGEEQKSVWS